MRDQNFSGSSIGLLVEALVFGEALDVGVLAEFRGRLELALFVQDGIDVGGLAWSWGSTTALSAMMRNLDEEECFFVPEIGHRIAEFILHSAGRM